MVHSEILPTPTIQTGKGVWTAYGASTINAPAPLVWQAVKDIESYAAWNQHTTKISRSPAAAQATPDVAVGEMITVAYRPERTGSTMDVPCLVLKVSDEEMEICWRGCMAGVPVFVLCPEKMQRVTSQGPDRCLYEVFETQSGPLAYVVKWSLGKKLGAMNQGIADDFKTYIESVRVREN